MILRLIEEENLHHMRIVHNQELNLKSLRIDRRVIRCWSSAEERQSVAMASDSPLNAVASGTRMLRNQHESAQINLKARKDVIHSKIVLRPDIEKCHEAGYKTVFAPGQYIIMNPSKNPYDQEQCQCGDFTKPFDAIPN